MRQLNTLVLIVVLETQAEADAARPIPITNGGATINGQRVTGIARNVIVRVRRKSGIT
jgi:hypothetical protein